MEEMRSHGTIDRSGEQVPEKAEAERLKEAMVALGGTRHRGCSRVQPLIRQMRLSGGAASGQNWGRWWLFGPGFPTSKSTGSNGLMEYEYFSLYTVRLGPFPASKSSFS